jgi:proteic killer suppression protein
MDDDPSGINPEHIERVQNILLTIDSATIVQDLNLPSYKLHPLKGNMKDTWAITVRANWRITFKFENGDAYILNYEDYH